MLKTLFPGLQVTLLKKTPTQVVPVKFKKFLRTPFFAEHLTIKYVKK